MIDVPASASNGAAPPVLDSTFVLAGWAADFDATVGTGIDTVHVWAYPVNGPPAAPVWIGASTYGGERPDVAAFYGDHFSRSGYGIVVENLPSGTYDLAVFAYSTVRRGFLPARVVRITVR